jgi:hypothetical protein
MSNRWRFWIAWATVVIAGLGVGYGAAAQSLAAPSQPFAVVPAATVPASTGGVFASLWQPFAGQNVAVLELFSSTSGRPAQTLASLPSWPASVSNPHATRDRALWMALSQGPRYRSGVAGGDPAPFSCRGAVARFDPVRGSTRTILTFPRSSLVTDAVPSADSGRLALLAGGCTTSYLNQHLLVRGLLSGRQWTIGSDALPCHALSSPAWSADGAKLVFAYGPSTLASPKPYVPGLCPAPQPSELAIAAGGRPTPLAKWQLIPASKGCSFQSAVFDRSGIAAIEGCSHGAPPRSAADTDLGDAYLVQLDSRYRMVLRMRLFRGSALGTLGRDPNTDEVLVSEDQAGNQGSRTFDWIWSFDGRHLRLVTRFPNQASPVVTAEPW